MLPLLIPFPAKSSLPAGSDPPQEGGQELLLHFAVIQRLLSAHFVSLCPQTSCAGAVTPPQPLQEELLGVCPRICTGMPGTAPSGISGTL